jgi:hypothetical protein
LSPFLLSKHLGKEKRKVTRDLGELGRRRWRFKVEVVAGDGFLWA